MPPRSGCPAASAAGSRWPGCCAAPHDLLLLDEPTNHLDIDAVQWLAGYLREHGRAFVVVTHDRWFLDAVTERTWEVADGRVHAYEGGYSAYVLARAERARIAEATDQRRRNLLRKELAWLRRGPPARTSKPKFRIEAATALIADEPPPRDSVELSRLATARLGKTVLELEDVSVQAGARRAARPRDLAARAGRAGRRGRGERQRQDHAAAAARREPCPARWPPRGRVVRGKTVRIGYLTQEPPAVDPGLRALEAAEQVRSSVRLGRREMSASQLLERLGLRGERQWVPVAELSGGERRRLQLMLVLLGEPNVLLLDEPTNDLDIDTLTELEDMLDGWPGSMVVVSHDRYFLERACDHVVALIDGALAYLPGGVAEYLDRIGRATGRGRAGRPRRGAAGATASPAARQRAAQKELGRLERQLDRVSGQEAELTAALAEHASDYARLIELGAQLRAVQDEKARPGGALAEPWPRSYPADSAGARDAADEQIAWLEVVGRLGELDPEHRLERVGPVGRLGRLGPVDRVGGLDPVGGLGGLRGRRWLDAGRPGQRGLDPVGAVRTGPSWPGSPAASPPGWPLAAASRPGSAQPRSASRKAWAMTR